MKSALKRLYDALPISIQKAARELRDVQSYIPYTFSHKKKRWIRNIYTKFANKQRMSIFLSIARFCMVNRPINGYYFEFGCHEANTMRMAWDTFHWLFDWEYVAFDSFEGLPEIEDIDKMKIWEKGKLKTSEEDFIRIVTQHGMPREKLKTVKGFYEQSLNSELKQVLLPTKSAVVYIDCDLYVSTVPVLAFIKDFLQIGTIIVFDDWNCFYGDPDKGERRAFREFLKKNPELSFEEFVSTNEAKSFIFLGEREN